MLIRPDALRSGKRNKLGTINEYRERVEVSSLSALNLQEFQTFWLPVNLYCVWGWMYYFLMT